MCDPERDEPWSSDDLAWRGSSDEGTRRRMTEMRLELGRRDSPAFERLKDYLSTPFEISGAVIAEIVQMLRHRCFADSQSRRKPRGTALWAELHWVTEDRLIDAFSVLWRPAYHQWWQSSTLVQHCNAGPALWTQVLSRRVDINTVVDIVAAANARNDRAFLQRVENSIESLDIVSSDR